MKRISALFLVAIAYFFFAPITFAAGEVVISEIQTAGTTASDEFVELYNTTNSDIDLTGWRLTKMSDSGVASEANLVSSFSVVIPANGYLLVVHPNYDGSVAADVNYSAPSNSVALDNTVTLYSDSGQTIVDQVGLGTATVFETVATSNPEADGSVRRVNNADTDDNSADFEILTISDPQNSSLSPTPSLTPTPTPTPSPEPTVEPTSTPEPTEEPTPSPSPTSTPEPTVEPTSTPIPSPTSTPEPTESPTPTPTSTPEPTQAPQVIAAWSFGSDFCVMEYHTIRIGFFKVRFPRLRCF